MTQEIDTGNPQIAHKQMLFNRLKIIPVKWVDLMNSLNIPLGFYDNKYVSSYWIMR